MVVVKIVAAATAGVVIGDTNEDDDVDGPRA